jgi:hypothetical protein
VPRRRFELLRGNPRQPLKLVCLPIPPPGHNFVKLVLCTCDPFCCQQKLKIIP